MMDIEQTSSMWNQIINGHRRHAEAESEDTMKQNYAAGHNMTGYLPESDVHIFATFEEAKAYQIDMMEWTADQLDGSDQHDEAEELSGAEQDLNLDSGPEWGVIVGNISWWINLTDEETDEED